MNSDPDASAFSRELAAAQVATLYRNGALGVTAAAVSASALAALLITIGLPGRTTIASWAGYIVVCALTHLILWRIRRRVDDADTQWRLWGNAFAAGAFAEGLGWGFAAVFLVPRGHFGVEMMVMVVCLSVAAGSITAFGSYLPAFFAIFIPTTLAYPIWSVLNYPLHSLVSGDPIQRASVVLMLVFIPSFAALGVLSNRSFTEVVGLRLRFAALSVDLQRQTSVAEDANRAKSAFLAAASHDLRQPVHAMGLFVGALRSHVLPEESARLVQQIEASVQATEGLFSALLDVSRLDAGLVEVAPRAFSLGELLERLAAEYSGEAAAKGLSLRLASRGGVVRTDPVLFERILRNLIGNAIGHTATGGVVFGFRRGARPRVEVWDSGPGIAVADRQRVFQEYVQLANPERDRSRGLGMGLAIVARLSALIGCAVELRSTPGCGSCFSIAVPTAAGAAVETPAKLSPASTTTGGLIAVIDDEAAIRDGMAALLTGWGHSVVVADCGAEIVQRLEKGGVAPDLVICDHRLRGDETGVDVIRRLRELFGESTHGMLISGDTAPERLLEAKASGLILIQKPISPGRLRAAIGNLMARPRLALQTPLASDERRLGAIDDA